MVARGRIAAINSSAFHHQVFVGISFYISTRHIPIKLQVQFFRIDAPAFNIYCQRNIPDQFADCLVSAPTFRLLVLILAV